MKANWIVEFLQTHNYEFERKIGFDQESEVWRNKVNILVIHPQVGIQLMYSCLLYTSPSPRD